MAGEIASAYVRIRPNMAGFKAETETGVRSAFSGVAKIIGGAVAVGGLAEFGKSIVEAASAHQAAFDVLDRTIKNAGASMKGFGASLDEVLAKEARLKGFSDEDLASAMVRLVSATGDTKKAFKDLGLAEDLARARHIDVAVAALALSKAEQGSFSALQRYGIIVHQAAGKTDELKAAHDRAVASGATFTVAQKQLYDAALKTAQAYDKQAKSQEAISLVQQRFGGAAKVFANTASGQFARLGQDFHQLEVAIGTDLLPTLASAAEGLGHFFDKIRANKTVEDDFHSFGKQAASALHDLKVGADAVGPPLLAVATAAQKVTSSVGAAPILAAVVAYKAAGVATGAWASAKGLWLKVNGQTVAAEVTETAATEGLTAAIVENTIAIRAQGAAAGGTVLSLTASAGAVEALGTAEAAATVESGGLGAGLLGLAGGPMGALTIAGAAAAAGLVYLISRENEWDAANKRVSSSVSDLTAATAAWNDIQAKGNLLQRAAALDALDAAYAKVTKSEQKQASAAQDAINTFGHSSEFLAKYVGQVETQSAAYRGQNPLLAHNLDLIGQLAVKIGKIPDKANIALLINNKNPTAALDEVLSGFSNIIAGIEQIDTKIANTFKGGIAAAKFKAFFQSVVDQITKVTAMAAAAGAKAQQNATDKTVAKLEAQLAQLTSTGNAALAVQAQDLAQQEQQGREQIAAAVQSAQQNFASIGNTIAQSISAIIDKPFETELLAITIAQDRITQKYDRLTAQLIPQANRLAAENAQAQLASDKLNLQNLRAEVILPGGKGLSSDPKKALEELRKLAAGANVLSKGAIQQFILEYSAALRAVKGDKLGIKQTSLQTARSAKETGLQLRSDDVKVAQDHADKVKAAVIQRIGDLTDAFNQGKLTWAKLSDDLASILGKNNVGFKRAGKLLGSAFEDAFKAQFTGLDLQAQAIAAGPHTPGAGLLPQIVKPEEVVKQTLLQNARSADALSKAQIAQQKATNALLTKIHNAQKGTKFTSSLDKNPGKQSKESGALAGTTG